MSNKLGSYHAKFSRNHRYAPLEIWLKIAKRIVFLAILGLIFYFLFFSSYFSVKNITVSGLNSVDQSNVEKYLNIGSNIFLYPIKSSLISIQKNNPSIAEINIYRGLPDTIKVYIVEYEPKLIWQRNNSRSLVNNSGLVFRLLTDSEETLDLPLVLELVEGELKIGDQVAPPSFIKFSQEIKARFPASYELTFDHIELASTSFEAVVKTKENINVLISSLEDIDQQLFYIEEVLAKRRNLITSKIDVRTPRWVYVE